MPLPVIANTYRCSLDWTCSTTPAVATNVIHVRGTGHTTAGVLAEVASDLTEAMFAATSTEATITQMTVQPLDGSSAGLTAGISGPHGGSGTDFSPAVCGIVTLRTGLAGRSHRGRVFTPFVAESIDTRGQISSADVTLMQDAWTTFFDTALPADGLELVVASYTLATATAVNSVTAQSVCGTMRRRQSQLR